MGNSMFSRSSMDHIVRDLIVRWQRTALCAVLLVIGLSVWLPMLFSALQRDRGGSPTAAESTTSISIAPGVTESVSQDGRFSVESSVGTLTRQENKQSRQQPDPLVRSIEVSAFHGNEFRSSPSREPHSIGNNNDNNLSTRSENESATSRTIIGRPILTGTIFNTKPKTAVINGTRYSERSEIRVNGKAFRLVSISQTSVELKRDGERIILHVHTDD